MPITIDGTGTIGGITAGGLPNGTVTRDDLATTAKGSILQVKQAVKTDRTSSAAGYVWTDTGLSVDITPTSTSSNILVMANVHLGGGNSYDLKIKILRDSTVIGVGDGDSGRPAVTSVMNIYDTTHALYQQAPVTGTYLDTAVSTTSQVTYKVQFASYGGYVAYVNRTEDYQLHVETTPEYDSTPISTLTLMEVAA